jgi:hypothetical protein
MYSWVVVTPPGRRAVTDEAGRFTLAGVPAGKYTLKVWHESLGEKELPVEVAAEGSELDPILFTPIKS